MTQTPTAEPTSTVRRVEELPRWWRGAYKLRFLGDPILGETADPFKVDTDAIHLASLVTAMTTVVEEHQALGLSAPQVGAGVRVIVAKGPRSKVMLMVNPVIMSTSWKETRRLESCLSIPGFAVHTTRFEGVTVSFLNDRLEVEEWTFAGVAAQIIQHEIDHLNGVTLTDNLSEKKQTLAAELVAKVRAKA